MTNVHLLRRLSEVGAAVTARLGENKGEMLQVGSVMLVSLAALQARLKKRGDLATEVEAVDALGEMAFKLLELTGIADGDLESAKRAVVADMQEVFREQ